MRESLSFENINSESPESIPKVEESLKTDTEQAKTQEEGPADRINREETEKRMPEMIRLVTKGLGDLFELLPKDNNPSADIIVKLIEHTGLNIMLPGMRQKFADELVSKKINLVEDKADFIAQSLETDAIKMFAHLEAMKAGTDEVLRRLHEEGVNSPIQENQAGKDAQRLKQLREELMGVKENTDDDTGQSDQPKLVL